jgi:hypothetical protein
MLGDYDKDEFDSGRGLKVQNNAIAAVATLTAVLGLDPDSMRLHKEDPLTTHACPGKKVSKPKFIQAVKDLLTRRHGVSILPGRRPEPRASLLPGAKFDGLGLDSESRERPKSAKPAGFGIEVDG